MKGVWKVTSNPIGGEMMYAVCRVRDTSQPVHSGNLEYAGEYSENREAMQVIADELNRREEVQS